jgi:hypothetical protein
MEPGHYSHFVEPRPSTSASHDFLDIHISRDSSCPDSSALDCLDTHPLNQPPSPLINTQLVPASSFKQHVWGFYSYSIASEVSEKLGRVFTMTIPINEGVFTHSCFVLLVYKRYIPSFQPVYSCVSFEFQ